MASFSRVESQLAEFHQTEVGRPIPMGDIRVVIFKEGKILLVQDLFNGESSSLGGVADIFYQQLLI